MADYRYSDFFYRTEMQAHYLTSQEIDYWLTLKTPKGDKQDFEPVFRSAPFQQMLKSRVEYVMKMHKAGFTGPQIREVLEKEYYRKRGQRKPTDFLKIEYKKPGRLSNYRRALKHRMEMRLARMAKKTGIKYKTSRSYMD